MFQPFRSVMFGRTPMSVSALHANPRYFSISSSLFARVSERRKVTSLETKARRQLKSLSATFQKRAPTSCNLYVKENVATSPGSSQQEKFANCMKSWNKLDAEGKEKYVKLAAAAKAKLGKIEFSYEDVIKAQTAKRLADKLGIKKYASVRIPKDSTRPKRPLSAYFMFLRDVRAATPEIQTKILGGPVDSMTLGQSTKILASKWKELPADRKVLYTNQADAERAKYKVAFSKYQSTNKINEYRKSLAKTLRVAAHGRDASRKRVLKRKPTLKRKVAKRKVKVIKERPSKKTATKKTATKKTAKKVVKKTTAAKKGVKKTVKH